MIRQAMLRRSPSVFIWEDDVTLHPDLIHRLSEFQLPDDWGMFFLGGMHIERPTVVGPGLVHARQMLSTHAFGVRSSHYSRVIKALRGNEREEDEYCPAADVIIARLFDEIPTYAAYPNLAGQEGDHSDLEGTAYDAYGKDLQQLWFQSPMHGVMAESLGGTAYAPSKALSEQVEGWIRTMAIPDKQHKRPEDDWDPRTTARVADPDGKVAFLFISQTGLPHASIWESYWEGAEEQVSKYGHSSAPQEMEESWFTDSLIDERFDSAWGDISLVRIQMALLRAALEDSDNEFFVFVSESCVPIRPLADLRESLRLDGRSRIEWGVTEDQPKIKQQRVKKFKRIPESLARFHPMWILLNREAAELVIEDDFTPLMENVFAPDECYFATVLNMKGYPMEELIDRSQLTFTQWPEGSVPSPDSFTFVEPEMAGQLMSTGAWFARKFTGNSNIGDYGLHLPTRSRCKTANGIPNA